MTENQKLAITELAQEVHAIAISKGWWEKPAWLPKVMGSTVVLDLTKEEVHAIAKAADRNDAELLMLIACELAEACEGLRYGNPPSDHIPEFSAMEEELADAFVRLLDMSAARGYRIAKATAAKIEFNRNRPYKHGGKKF